MIFKKTTGMAAVVTAAVAVAGLAPQQALAEKYTLKGGSSAQADIERRLQMMEDEMRALRAELAKARSDSKASAERMDAQQQKVDKQLAEAEAHEKEHHDLLFFRGGYAKMEHGRGYKGGNPSLRETLLNNTESNDNDGWYVGAGFDHRLSDDFWGLTDMVSVDGEVMFEYKNFGTGTNTLVNVVTGDEIKNKITQLTLTAAPKIKFNNMGNFRPWIIPFGLGLHIISPPSSGITVLNPGLMIGTGAEYRIWGDLWAGLDFRYHFTGDDLKSSSKSGALKGVDTDGLTAGAYLGFGF
ncbi:hypothetical protein ACWJKU_04065 [Methylocaldum sp. MU1018]